MSIVLAFSLVLAGCGVGPGSSGNADHAFIVSGDAFRLAERSLLGEGVVVNVVEPLSFDAAAGLAAFATSEAGVFVHATVRDGVEATVVVMAFDDEGGWVFTDSVSGARAGGDVAALERLAASGELNNLVASSDVALACALLEVFGFGCVDVLDDGVQVSCAACSSEQGRLSRAQGAVALATAAYAHSFKAFLACVLPPACAAALLWNQANAAALILTLIALDEATRDLNACKTRNSC